MLFLHGLLNTFGVSLVARLNDISVWWHVVGVLIIVGVLFIVPKHHQSVSFVFTHFENQTGFSFPLAGAYVVLTGLLNAQYTFTGYDASAHMTEETHNAAIAGPRGHRVVDHRLALRGMDAADRRHIRDHPIELRRRVRRLRRRPGCHLHRCAG